MGTFDTYLQTRILRPIRLKAILKIINRLPDGKIVDVGCMDDYLLKRLPSRFDYIGFDETPLCDNPRIKKGRVEDYKGSKKFDIVLCTEVLEHLDDPVSAMKKLKRLSSRYVLISVPHEPFFALARGFIPASEHLWTIFPMALERQFGKPVFKTHACFNRTYIALFDLKNKKVL